MQLARVFLALGVMVILTTLTSHAQSPFGSGATVIKNATVFTDGKIVDNCHLLFSGKKLRAIGTDIKIPDDADVIDGKGKFIVPTLIDASASMGLFSGTTASRVKRAHFSILDRLNLFDVADFGDAIEQGVTHAYLRNRSPRGFGAQGAGIVLPKKPGGTKEDILVKGSQAIHVKLGTSSGPIGRYMEVKGFGGQLLAAKKYRESWKKYKAKLKEYVEGLGSKNKKKPTKKKTSKSKKGGKTPKVAPKKKAVTVPGFLHSPEEGAHNHDDHNDQGRLPQGPVVDEIEGWDIWSLGNIEDHPVVKAKKARELTAHNDVAIPQQWQASDRQLSPAYSFVSGDGTEPHLVRGAEVNQNDPSSIELLVCEHCGGQIEGQPHFHPKAEGFDFWEFAPDPRTSSKKSKKSKSKKAAKKPTQPRYDPAMEAMADLLEGKMRLRIEVHRAEDIKNLLKILEDHPMEVVLEGVTEGYRVADALAKADVPVIVFGDVEKPIQESDNGAGLGALPFTFFRFRRFRRMGPTAPSGGLPVEGEFRADNAALMAAKGVDVAIAASLKSANASPQLLMAAARLAGLGLPKEKALSAVSELPAKMLGIGDQVGVLKKGRRASFVVLNGDPFSPSTRVQSIYRDGKRFYKKK